MFRSASRVLVAALVASVLVAAIPARAQGPAAPNTMRLVMRTPHGGFDRLVVSIDVCEPGSGRCATIDDVMVDTGSIGLRLEASAVPAWLRLPPVLGPGGRPLAECLRFVHDTAWGPLRRADVRLGGLTATDLPLQVIDDGGGPQPAACPRSDVRPTSNGTLGIGQHPFDCQGDCVQRAEAPGVFAGDGSAWGLVEGGVAPAYRLPNPVTVLPVHDNGVVIDLPSPSGGGAAEIEGTLIFGVGTADDNRIDGFGVVRLDTAGHFTTVLDGKRYPPSFIDSGTETYILHDEGLPRCPAMTWAYCVEPPRTLRAEMMGRDGTRVPVAFTVGDYEGRRRQRAGAADDVAEVSDRQTTTVVWGAPLFLGRRIALVVEGRGVPGAPELVGPFYGLK